MDILKIDVRKWAESVSNIALDELLYKGKTLRQWADALTDPKTRSDNIRAMSDEELAENLMKVYDCPKGKDCVEQMTGEDGFQQCKRCWVEWLREEVDS